MSTAITEPGVYDLPAAEYHADPCPTPSLSATVLTTLLTRSPLHAAMLHPRLTKARGKEHKPEFDIGTMAHSLLLNDPVLFMVVDAPDWRTDKARGAKAAAYGRGRIPILKKDWQDVRDMIDACREQVAEHEASWLFNGKGHTEQTFVWQSMGVWCRAKPDWYIDAGHEIIMADYKTEGGTASPEFWSAGAFSRHLHDVRAAFYCSGARTIFRKPARYIFVVQEKKLPWCISVFEPTKACLQHSGSEVDRGTEIWAQMLRDRLYPGYAARIIPIDTPSWTAKRRAEREILDPIGDTYVQDMIAAQ